MPNAWVPILVTPSGSHICFRLIQPSNVEFSMLVTPLGILTLIRDSHAKNAPPPIEVTLSGIKMFVILLGPSGEKNAQDAMSVTGKPLIVSGIITVSSEPV